MKKNKPQFFSMKNLISKMFVFILFVITMTNCTSEQKAKDKINTYANYYIRYLQPEDKIKAEATFSKGKSLENAKNISIENGVFFHGGNMDEKNIPKIGTRYSANRQGSFSTEYQFKYTDTEKGKSSYTVNMNNLEELVVNETISKSKGMQVSWSGKSLNENETLVFLFNDAKNKASIFEIKGPSTASNISIPSEKLIPLAEGKAKVYLVRKQSKKEETLNTIINSESEYYSRVFTVTILP